MNRITVIVPAFNAQSTICNCITALQRQSSAAMEILVVDDASTDDTAGVAERAGAKVIRLPRNGGPGVARNAGARVALGELLAFTDADCVPPEDWLQRMAGELQRQAAVAATGGYSGPVRPTFLTQLQHLVLRQRQAGLPPKIASTISSNLICRRDIFLSVGGFPLYFSRARPERPVWGNEDEELGFKLAEKGTVIWVPGIGVRHEFRGDFSSYLRQQRFYAHSIVVSHFRFPALARSTSNYGRSSGALQVLGALGALLGTSVASATTLCLGSAHDTVAGLFDLLCSEEILVGALGIVLMSAPFFLAGPVRQLAGLWKTGASAGFLLRAYPVLLAVILAWLSGVLSGAIVGIRGFEDGTAERRATFAAAD